MEVTIKGDVEEIKDLLQVICGNEEQDLNVMVPIKISNDGSLQSFEKIIL